MKKILLIKKIFLILIIFIFFIYLLNPLFIKNGICAQTSNNIYFLSKGQVWFNSFSNELIPEEGPGIWHIKTNFDNECFYIVFDIIDTTNPDNKYLDVLNFYIDLSDNNYLSEKTVFGYSVGRNNVIKYYRFSSSIGNYYQVLPPEDGSMGYISIGNDWKVYFTFNYSQFGYLNQIENQTIGFMAQYWDHCIGSIILDYKYPSTGNPLNRITWSTGYFIEGYCEINNYNIFIWVIVISIIVSVVVITYFGCNKYSTPNYKKGNKAYTSSNDYLGKQLYFNLLYENENENDNENENNNSNSLFTRNPNNDIW
ncbi:MAG: hypothetical protein ACTSPY_02520 [Candidatus Helarchaeota archaeon]